MKIGFIGLGRMGSGMAMRLLSTKHALAVFHPKPGHSARFGAAGARIATRLMDLGSDRDVVISMLPNDAALRQVALGPGGLVSTLRAGAIHMISGTHSVTAIREVIDAHRAASQVPVACHVLGRPELAVTGKLGLVCAGPPAAIETLRPIFAAIGQRLFEAGEDPLAATAIKVANNLVLGCAIEAIGEGMALVRNYGVDPLVFHQVLVGGLFSSTAYEAYGDLIARADWGRVGATATIGLKDANLALEAARAVDTPLPSVEIWKAHLQAAIARGEGDLDWSVMAREQFRASGLE
jgi:3-hydroxyisobutyrate dehydrogenase-like beta-hydroxyacid dehydrogenase